MQRAQCVRAAYTVRVCSVHNACVQRAQCGRAACTMRACSVYNACVQCAQCVRAVCTMRACSVHNAGVQRAQCVLAVCTVRACSLHNAGVQRAQCVRAHYKHFHQAPIPHLVALTPPCNIKKAVIKVAMIATTAAIAFPRDEKLKRVVRGGEGLTYRHASDRASQGVGTEGGRNWIPACTKQNSKKQ